MPMPEWVEEVADKLVNSDLVLVEVHVRLDEFGSYRDGIALAEYLPYTDDLGFEIKPIALVLDAGLGEMIEISENSQVYPIERRREHDGRTD